tara:strand:- start:3405 stop:11285 length:7881 start_codon:yes stop_codon:yes gene_type:complete
MPKELIELTKFIKGTVTSPSDEDVQLEVASYSLDLAPMGPDGMLQSRRTDYMMWDVPSAEVLHNITESANISWTNEAGVSKQSMIIYDASTQGSFKLWHIENAGQTDAEGLFEPVTPIYHDFDSGVTSIEITGAMEVNNQEVHIGLGTFSPKWIGKPNFNQFGEKPEDNLVMTDGTLNRPNSFETMYKVVNDGNYYYGIRWKGNYVHKFNITDKSYIGVGNQYFDSTQGLAAKEGTHRLFVYDGGQKKLHSYNGTSLTSEFSSTIYTSIEASLNLPDNISDIYTAKTMVYFQGYMDNESLIDFENSVSENVGSLAGGYIVNKKFMSGLASGTVKIKPWLFRITKPTDSSDAEADDITPFLGEYFGDDTKDSNHKESESGVTDYGDDVSEWLYQKEGLITGIFRDGSGAADIGLRVTPLAQVSAQPTLESAQLNTNSPAPSSTGGASTWQNFRVFEPNSDHAQINHKINHRDGGGWTKHTTGGPVSNGSYVKIMETECGQDTFGDTWMLEQNIFDEAFTSSANMKAEAGNYFRISFWLKYDVFVTGGTLSSAEALTKFQAGPGSISVMMSTRKSDNNIAVDSVYDDLDTTAQKGLNSFNNLGKKYGLWSYAIDEDFNQALSVTGTPSMGLANRSLALTTHTQTDNYEDEDQHKFGLYTCLTGLPSYIPSGHDGSYKRGVPFQGYVMGDWTADNSFDPIRINEVTPDWAELAWKQFNFVYKMPPSDSGATPDSAPKLNIIFSDFISGDNGATVDGTLNNTAEVTFKDGSTATIQVPGGLAATFGDVNINWSFGGVELKRLSGYKDSWVSQPAYDRENDLMFIVQNKTLVSYKYTNPSDTFEDAAAVAIEVLDNVAICTLDTENKLVWTAIDDWGVQARTYDSDGNITSSPVFETGKTGNPAYMLSDFVGPTLVDDDYGAWAQSYTYTGHLSEINDAANNPYGDYAEQISNYQDTSFSQNPAWSTNGGSTFPSATTSTAISTTRSPRGFDWPHQYTGLHKTNAALWGIPKQEDDCQTYFQAIKTKDNKFHLFIGADCTRGFIDSNLSWNNTEMAGTRTSLIDLQYSIDDGTISVEEDRDLNPYFIEGAGISSVELNTDLADASLETSFKSNPGHAKDGLYFTGPVFDAGSIYWDKEQESFIGHRPYRRRDRYDGHTTPNTSYYEGLVGGHNNFWLSSLPYSEWSDLYGTRFDETEKWGKFPLTTANPMIPLQFLSGTDPAEYLTDTNVMHEKPLLFDRTNDLYFMRCNNAAGSTVNHGSCFKSIQLSNTTSVKVDENYSYIKAGQFTAGETDGGASQVNSTPVWDEQLHANTGYLNPLDNSITYNVPTKNSSTYHGGASISFKYFKGGSGVLTNCEYQSIDNLVAGPNSANELISYIKNYRIWPLTLQCAGLDYNSDVMGYNEFVWYTRRVHDLALWRDLSDPTSTIANFGVRARNMASHINIPKVALMPVDSYDEVAKEWDNVTDTNDAISVIFQLHPGGRNHKPNYDYTAVANPNNYLVHGKNYNNYRTIKGGFADTDKFNTTHYHIEDGVGGATVSIVGEPTIGGSVDSSYLEISLNQNHYFPPSSLIELENTAIYDGIYEVEYMNDDDNKILVKNSGTLPRIAGTGIKVTRLDSQEQIPINQGIVSVSKNFPVATEAVNVVKESNEAKITPLFSHNGGENSHFAYKYEIGDSERYIPTIDFFMSAHEKYAVDKWDYPNIKFKGVYTTRTPQNDDNIDEYAQWTRTHHWGNNAVAADEGLDDTGWEDDVFMLVTDWKSDKLTTQLGEGAYGSAVLPIANFWYDDKSSSPIPWKQSGFGRPELSNRIFRSLPSPPRLETSNTAFDGNDTDIADMLHPTRVQDLVLWSSAAGDRSYDNHSESAYWHRVRANTLMPDINMKDYTMVAREAKEDILFTYGNEDNPLNDNKKGPLVFKGIHVAAGSSVSTLKIPAPIWSWIDKDASGTANSAYAPNYFIDDYFEDCYVENITTNSRGIATSSTDTEDGKYHIITASMTSGAGGNNLFTEGDQVRIYLPSVDDEATTYSTSVMDCFSNDINVGESWFQIPHNIIIPHNIDAGGADTYDGVWMPYIGTRLVVGTAFKLEVEESNEGTKSTSGYKYWYKLSLEYDGYQDGPLGDASIPIVSTGKDINITVLAGNVGGLSPRISGLKLWRAVSTNEDALEPEGFYRFCTDINISSSTTTQGTDEGLYTGQGPSNETVKTIEVTDPNVVGGHYESLVGVPEAITNFEVNYGISCQLNNHLFVAQGEIALLGAESRNYLVKSMPYRFNTFDLTKDILRLPFYPTAIKAYLGRIYAFSANKIARIEPNSLFIEDIQEGMGTFSDKSVIVNDYGMFFADDNGIYQHNGQAPQDISMAIKDGIDWVGTNNPGGSVYGSPNPDGNAWRHVYKDYPGFPGEKITVLGFDYNNKSLLVSCVVGVFTDDEDGGDFSRVDANCRVWSYNLIKARWDLQTMATYDTYDGVDGQQTLTDRITHFFHNYRGQLSYWIRPRGAMIGQVNRPRVREGAPIGMPSVNYHAPWRYITNEISLGSSTLNKIISEVVIKWKTLHQTDAVTDFTGTCTIYIDGVEKASNLTSSTNSGMYKTAKYKIITPSNRKGKSIRLKLDSGYGSELHAVESIGIKFRPLRTS